MKILIGCDPELFTKDRQTGLFVSAHRMLEGTKEFPTPCKGGATQIDGTALEFNIDPAANCNEFVHNIGLVRGELDRAVAEFNVDIVAEPVAEFDEEYFKTLPPHVLELGCNPDYNAWAMAMNEPPDGDRPYRTGSGHIHIGWGSDFDVESEEHFTEVATLIRQLDYYVGIESLKWDQDNRRRSMYGQAGAFRPKPYGGEYRVLSNAWLRDERTTRFVYDACHKAVTDLAAGINKSAEFGSAARDIINNNEIDWFERHDFGTGMDYRKYA